MDTKTDIAPPSGELRYPFETTPAVDGAIEVAPGILWVRLSLPFRLNHVNVYLLKDGDGWTLIDTGIGTEKSIELWTVLFDGALKDVNITRLIVTHAHPDHAGLAGWMTERFGCHLYMSQVEYLQAVFHQNRGTDDKRAGQRRFFRLHGMDEGIVDELLGRGQDYLKRVSSLPASYRRLTHGEDITIGERTFRVITGGGHALDQVMLYCASDRIFFAADQVLSKISPNVSVWSVEPDANPLHEYLTSLHALAGMMPADTLVLPGHGIPFYGLHVRIKQLADHHEERCQIIAEACREQPLTSAQLVPLVFHKHKLDAHQTGFAAGELIAHVNHMLAQGRLTGSETDGVLRFKSA